MRIKIIDFTNGETNFVTEIGAGLAVMTTEVEIGAELDAELRIDTVYQWQKDIDFAVEGKSAHRPCTTAKPKSRAIRRIHRSPQLDHPAAQRFGDLDGRGGKSARRLWRSAALITLRTDLLELFPFQL
jgi:hypothetical protein